MNKSHYLLSLLFLFVVSCSNNNNKINFETKQVINLSDNETLFDVIDKINSIEVLELAVDDNWKYLDFPKMIASVNGYTFLTPKTFYLVHYDVNGNIKYSKQIKGRGRGEVINVGNIFERSDTLMIYDSYIGRILCYNSEGKFCSFLGGAEFDVDKLYPTKNAYYGISKDGGLDNYYCTLYNTDGSLIDRNLPLPSFLHGLNFSVGRSDLSYIFHDTLRFMLNFDYNILSLTKNSLESSYYFSSSNQIPDDYFEEKNGVELKIPNIVSDLLSNGYTCQFEGLFETDRYLIVNYTSNSKRYLLLYDKRNNTFGRLEAPDALFEESMVPLLTTKDIWRYIMFSFTRLYSDDDNLYGQVPFSLYTILTASESLFDEKIRSFYDGLSFYVESQKLSFEDKIFIKMSF